MASLLAATQVAGGVGSGELQRPKKRFRNLVFLCIDDLNDWVSVLQGHPNARTPNIDRIAKSGMIFTDAHVAAPLCNPSRTATFHATLPTTSGVYFNRQDWRECTRLESRPSIFRWLRKEGIRSVGTGKIHHKTFVDPDCWDQYWPSVKEPRPHESFPVDKFSNGIKYPKGLQWAPVPTEERTLYVQADTKVAREACKILAGLSELEVRFALSVGLYRPHLPWIVPQKFFDLFPLDSIQLPFTLTGDLDDVPEIARTLAMSRNDHKRLTSHGLWRNAVQAYLASVAFADEKAGEIFDSYIQTSCRDDTVFVLWSDNGWHLGEKSAWRKTTLWREATRVPLIVVAPGRVRPGSVCQRPVSLTSIYATICELMGIEIPTHCEGRSLCPLLDEHEDGWDEPVVSAIGIDAMAVRTSRWCYIKYRDGQEELYDRDRDPREFQNLAGVVRPSILMSLRALLPNHPATHDPIEGSEDSFDEDED